MNLHRTDSEQSVDAGDDPSGGAGPLARTKGAIAEKRDAFAETMHELRGSVVSAGGAVAEKKDAVVAKMTGVVPSPERAVRVARDRRGVATVMLTVIAAVAALLIRRRMARRGRLAAIRNLLHR